MRKSRGDRELNRDPIRSTHINEWPPRCTRVNRRATLVCSSSTRRHATCELPRCIPARVSCVLCTHSSYRTPPVPASISQLSPKLFKT